MYDVAILHHCLSSMVLNVKGKSPSKAGSPSRVKGTLKGVKTQVASPKQSSKAIEIIAAFKGPIDSHVPAYWIFKNAYDIKDFLKRLSNDRGELTFLGDVEFRSFSNLRTKWISTSLAGNLLWIIRIENDGIVDDDDDTDRFPIGEEYFVAYANKIGRAIQSANIRNRNEIIVNTDHNLLDEEYDDVESQFANGNVGGGFNDPFPVADEDIEGRI